jgi:hypothetical protein
MCCKAQNKQSQIKSQIKVTEEFVQGSEDILLLARNKKTLDYGLGFDRVSGNIITSSYRVKNAINAVK